MAARDPSAAAAGKKLMMNFTETVTPLFFLPEHSPVSVFLEFRMSEKLFLRLFSAGLLLAFSLSFAEPSHARCEKSDLLSSSLITDICWDCVLPIVVAQVKLGGASGGSWIPENASDRYLCSCPGAEGFSMPGIVTSFWEPARLIEFETSPGCLSVLNISLESVSDPVFRGTHGRRDDSAGDEAFFHYHYYAFPILEMLSLFTGNMCNSDGYHDLDLMYFSELDPTWNDDTLAFFVNPEAVLTANPLAAAACMADAASSQAHRPYDSLFWCAGSWGYMYPLSGHVNHPSGVLKTTSLLTARVLAALHRRGFASRTAGNGALCRGETDTVIPKSQYKFSLLRPLPEAESAHGMGESALKWGYGRSIPGVAENPVYLIWRWRDCCNTLSLSGR